jgi:endonuclease YncB( thermonuclease family)
MRLKMRAGLAAILTILLAPDTAMAMTLPDCAGTVDIAQARIARVEKDGALVLRDGHSVLLEGIRLPGADHPSDPVAQLALDTLRELAGAAALTLTVTPPEQDRYGRLRVQAFGNVWLQTEMLKRGLARVMIAPDRQECYPDFYEAETEARNAGRGLWASPAFAVRQAAAFSALAGSFQLVEGLVVAAATHDGRVFLDFSTDYRNGFSATVAPDDHKAFRGNEPAIEDLAGHKIRLRGIVERFGGRAEIALSNPRQIEILK